MLFWSEEGDIYFALTKIGYYECEDFEWCVYQKVNLCFSAHARVPPKPLKAWLLILLVSRKEHQFC